MTRLDLTGQKAITAGPYRVLPHNVASGSVDVTTMKRLMGQVPPRMHERLKTQDDALAAMAFESGDPLLLSDLMAGPDGSVRLFSDAPQDPDLGQAVIYTDDLGFSSWHFPESAHDAATRGFAAPGGENAYVLPLRLTQGNSATPQSQQTWGVPKLGGKLLRAAARIVAFPIGKYGGTWAIGKWEERNRPVQLRRFDETGYDKPVNDQINLGGTTGRALLMIHGTNSLSHTGFAGFKKAHVTELNRMYGQQVFAYDHPTLSVAPQTNATDLYSRIQGSSDLTIDVICHSRGGLVAKELLAILNQLGGSGPQIGKVVFVAVPHEGTALANSQHMNKFIDTYMALMDFLPPNPVPLGVEGVLALVKEFAAGIHGNLEGLKAMSTGNSRLATLNNTGARGGQEFFGVGANYEPNGFAPGERVKDFVIDSVFGKEIRNDLVVPTDGALLVDKSHEFRMTEILDYPGGQGVWHSSYFPVKSFENDVNRWLT